MLSNKKCKSKNSETAINRFSKYSSKYSKFWAKVLSGSSSLIKLEVSCLHHLNILTLHILTLHAILLKKTPCLVDYLVSFQSFKNSHFWETSWWLGFSWKLYPFHPFKYWTYRFLWIHNHYCNKKTLLCYLFVSYSCKKFDTSSVLFNLLAKFLTKTKYLRIYITTEKASIRYDSYFIRYITISFICKNWSQ